MCSFSLLSSVVFPSSFFSPHCDFLFKWRKSVLFLYICIQSLLFRESSALKRQLSSSNKAIIIYKLQEKTQNTVNAKILLKVSYPLWDNSQILHAQTSAVYKISTPKWLRMPFNAALRMLEKQMLGRRKPPTNLNFLWWGSVSATEWCPENHVAWS